MDFLLNFSHYWTEKTDSRVLHLPLINSVYQMLLIIFAYLYFVLVCGPRFMKDRPPYSLKTFIRLYNIVQIAANVWLVYNFLNAGLLSRKLFCPIETDYTNSLTAMKNIECAWYYFLLKLLDYVETGIFVLRKKNNQVSWLHVYHHVSTLIVSWLALKYCCIAAAVFVSVINSAVHAMMYTYYFLASYGPNIQKTILPMKRWITIIQMIQFGFMFLYVSQNFVCKTVSHWVILIFNHNLILVFFLFYNFYKKTYTKSKKMN